MNIRSRESGGLLKQAHYRSRIRSDAMAAALHYSLRGVNAILFQNLPIRSLSESPGRAGEGVLPSQIVPVLHMVCQHYYWHCKLDCILSLALQSENQLTQTFIQYGISKFTE